MRTLRSTRPAFGADRPRRVAQPARSVVEDRPHGERAPLALRVRVYLTRGRLDRRIRAGCPCDATPGLVLRAAQLTGMRTRRQTAHRLRELVDYVDRCGSRPAISSVVVDPPIVSSARHAILGLAQRLEADAPVAPRGVVLARELLTDGLGPLFNRSSERTVVAAAWDTVDALEGRAIREADFAPPAPRARVAAVMPPDTGGAR